MDISLITPKESEMRTIVFFVMMAVWPHLAVASPQGEGEKDSQVEGLFEAYYIATGEESDTTRNGSMNPIGNCMNTMSYIFSRTIGQIPPIKFVMERFALATGISCGMPPGL